MHDRRRTFSVGFVPCHALTFHDRAPTDSSIGQYRLRPSGDAEGAAPVSAAPGELWWRAVGRGMQAPRAEGVGAGLRRAPTAVGSSQGGAVEAEALPIAARPLLQWTPGRSAISMAPPSALHLPSSYCQHLDNPPRP